MHRTILFAAASVLALAGGFPAEARPIPAGAGIRALPPLTHSAHRLLYNQNSNNTDVGIVSQNFSSAYSQTYDAADADDFIVPAGRKWKIAGVDVTGVYFNGSGPAASENVTFYSDDDGEPGKPLKHGSYTDLAGKDHAGSFSIVLPKKLVLGPGHYWVSVVANENFECCGEWGWEGNSVIYNDPAQWKYPSYTPMGDMCTTWGSNDYCLGYNQDDMFDLRGTASKGK